MCSSGGATVSTRQSPPAAGHDWAAELLAALLDGELDETTAAAVTAHVQECAECSRDWAELRATKQLLAALPAARAPRSYAILADDLAEPGRAGATFWPRLLGLTWRLSGALAVVIILIGTMQLAGINLGGEAETQYIQAEPQAAPARPAGELGATELPAAQQAAAPAAPAGPRGERAAAGAAGPAGQTIVVEKERPVVVEKVVERVERPVEKVVEKVVAVEKIVGKQVVAADAARAPAPTATRTATPTPSPTATATTPPTATPAPTAVPTPAPAARTAAPQREPAGPTFTPGVLWLIGGAVVVVVAGAAWLGERWVRRTPGVTGFTQWPPYVPPAPQGDGPVAARPPSTRPGVRATGLRLLPAARPAWAWTAR